MSSMNDIEKTEQCGNLWVSQRNISNSDTFINIEKYIKIVYMYIGIKLHNNRRRK